VDLLFASVAEEFVVEHDVLPGDGFVEFELDLVDLVARLHVDEEVGVVEDGVDQQVGRVLDVVDAPRRWLDEHVLRHSALPLLQQHPAVHALPQVEVGGEFVGLVVVDGQRFGGQFLLDAPVVLDDCLVEGGVGGAFGEDGLVEVELLLDVLVLVGLAQVGQEVALHQRLVLAGDLLGRDAVHAVGVVAHPDQQRAQQDAHVEAVALLPPRHVGRRGDAARELVGRVQFLVLDELAEALRALLVVVEFEEAELGGADGGADELVDLALVLGEEEELAVLADVLLELLLELDDVLQHQFLLGRVLPVGHRRPLLVLELAAPLQLLVYHVLPPLEELPQLAVGLALHLKISIRQTYHQFHPGLYRRKHTCFSRSMLRWDTSSYILPP
jgi:hypothetical protein